MNHRDHDDLTPATIFTDALNGIAAIFVFALIGVLIVGFAG